MRLLATILLVVAVIGTASAQPWLAWIDRYTGASNNSNETWDAARDNNGNILVWSNDHLNGQVGTLIKYSPTGQRLWARPWKPADAIGHNGADVAVAPDGTVYTTGYSDIGSRPGVVDTVKWDQNGGILWVHRMQSPDYQWDVPYDIAVDPYGGAYVVGYSGGWGQTDRWLAYKIDSDGQLAWIRRPPANLNDYANIARRVIVAPEAGLVYAAGTKTNGQISTDISRNRHLIGCAYGYDGTQHPYFRVAPFSEHSGSFNPIGLASWDGDLVLTGHVSVPGGPWSVPASALPVIRISPQGAVRWFYVLDPHAGERRGASHFVQIGDGYCLVGGGTQFDFALSHGVVVKLNGQGEETIAIWHRPTPEFGGGFCKFVQAEADGAIVAAGGRYDGPTRQDIYAAKFTDEGRFLWDYRYNGPGNNVDTLQRGFMDDRGGLYLVGTSVGVVSLADVVVIKLCQRWGDADNDGRVDDRDLAMVLENFGAAVHSGQNGDVTEDGIVDDADLSLVLWMFGTTCAPE